MHPIDIVPPTSTASPSDMDHPSYGDDVPFWKPDFADIVKHLGWRWILFLPAFLIIAALVALPWTYQYSGVLLIGGGKLLVLGIGIAITTAGTAIRSAVKQRTGPFCIHCGYDLTGLEEGHLCPECGRPFSLKLIEEYRRDPHWFVQRYKNGKDGPMADEPFIAGAVRRKKSRDGT
jgi:hypothetical protein